MECKLQEVCILINAQSCHLNYGSSSEHSLEHKGDRVTQMKKNKSKIIAWTIALLWMALIFKLSSEVATDSDGLSKGIAQFIMNLLHISSSAMDYINHIVRKNAHFFAYLVLGILVRNAFKQSCFSGLKLYLITFIVCIVYASSDEFHQRFVAGRSPQITDVLIDSSGSALGLLITFVINKLKSLK